VIFASKSLEFITHKIVAKERLGCEGLREKHGSKDPPIQRLGRAESTGSAFEEKRGHPRADDPTRAQGKEDPSLQLPGTRSSAALQALPTAQAM
jgi:hypothetical protein